MLYVEVFFGLPGIGKLTADTLGGLDLPPIVGLAVFLAIVVVVTNALVDVVVAWLDPRLRAGSVAAIGRSGRFGCTVGGRLSHDRRGLVDRPSFTRGQLAFIIGVPAAWAILLLFHPIGDDARFYPTIDGNVVAWQAVHIGMAVFIPLFAGAVYLLLRGVRGTAATVSRIALVVFAIFYAAFEITLGVGTGILTEQVNALPEAEQPVGVGVLESYAESGIITAFTVIGSIALATAMVAAAVALRGAYGLGWAPLLLILLCVPLIAIHEPPFGPIGLAMFVVAVVLFVREGASVSAEKVASRDHPVQARPA